MESFCVSSESHKNLIWINASESMFPEFPNVKSNHLKLLFVPVSIELLNKNKLQSNVLNLLTTSYLFKSDLCDIVDL